MPELSTLLAAVEPAVLGQRIKQLRLERGMTQSQLAGDAASTPFISRIEAGTRRPHVLLLEHIARTLGVPADELAQVDLDGGGSLARMLELDHIELELRTGNAAEALRRLDSLERGVLTAALDRRRRRLRAEALEAHGRLNDAIRELRSLVPEAERSGSIEVFIALSRCHREQGDMTRAKQVAEQGMQEAERLGLTASTEAAELTLTAASAHYVAGDLHEAIRLCDRALELAEQAGAEQGLAAAYWNSSIMVSQTGDLAQAITLAEKALALFEHGGNSRHLARLRAQLGDFQLDLDPPQPALALATLTQASQELAHSAASAIDIARTDLALARAHLLAGDAEQAETVARATLDRLDALEPSVYVRAQAHIVLGRTLGTRGDAADARRHFSAAVAALTAAGDDRGAAQLWLELAEELEGQGSAEEARDAYRRAAVSAGLRPGARVARPVT